MKKSKKAIFIDKDGTLIPDIPYNVDPALITLEKDLVEGLRSLQEKGYLLVVITNQAGVAKGYFPADALSSVKRKLEDLLELQHLHLDGFYYCPHHPEGVVKDYSFECECRKPRAGLILKAATELDINLLASWMIGDILNDVEAANSAGCRSVLVNNGNETEWLMSPEREPSFVVDTINEAAGYILNDISIGVGDEKEMV